jgi:hypothetical protein
MHGTTYRVIESTVDFVVKRWDATGQLSIEHRTCKAQAHPRTAFNTEDAERRYCAACGEHLKKSSGGVAAPAILTPRDVID